MLFKKKFVYPPPRTHCFILSVVVCQKWRPRWRENDKKCCLNKMSRRIRNLTLIWCINPAVLHVEIIIVVLGVVWSARWRWCTRKAFLWYNVGFTSTSRKFISQIRFIYFVFVFIFFLAYYPPPPRSWVYIFLHSNFSFNILF